MLLKRFDVTAIDYPAPFGEFSLDECRETFRAAGMRHERLLFELLRIVGHGGDLGHLCIQHCDDGSRGSCRREKSIPRAHFNVVHTGLRQRGHFGQYCRTGRTGDPQRYQPVCSYVLIHPRHGHGFLRVRCADCADDKLVAFSCKRRGCRVFTGASVGSCGLRRRP